MAEVTLVTTAAEVAKTFTSATYLAAKAICCIKCYLTKARQLEQMESLICNCAQYWQDSSVTQAAAYFASSCQSQNREKEYVAEHTPRIFHVRSDSDLGQKWPKWKKKQNRGSKIIQNLPKETLAKWQHGTIHAKKTSTTYFFFFHSHFSASCWSLGACEGGKGRKQGCESVFVCIWQWKNSGSACQRVTLLASERAGKWEHNPDYGRPRTPSHTATQRLRGGKQTRCTEKLLHAVKVHSCVFFHKEVEKHFRV